VYFQRVALQESAAILLSPQVFKKEKTTSSLDGFFCFKCLGKGNPYGSCNNPAFKIPSFFTRVETLYPTLLNNAYFIKQPRA